MIWGLHGTTLAAARRILRSGWDLEAAAWQATPRIRTGPEWVYACWADPGQDLEVLLPVAQGWAEEACERLARRPYEAAVLLVSAEALETPWAEPVAHYRRVTFHRVVAVGRELDHGHPLPWTPSDWPLCPRCWQSEFAWRKTDD